MVQQFQPESQPLHRRAPLPGQRPIEYENQYEVKSKRFGIEMKLHTMAGRVADRRRQKRGESNSYIGF